MRDLVIFGAGGHAREVHEVVKTVNATGPATWRLLGFLDDDESQHGRTCHGLPILGGVEWLRGKHGVAVIVAVGSPRARRAIVERITSEGHEDFATLVHPRAWLGEGIQLGPGTVVCAGANLTTDITLGSHVIANQSCTVGHDTHIGDYATLAPASNVSGNVMIEEGCDLGTNVVIIPDIRVGAGSVLGAGAVVTSDIPPDSIAVGVPAKATRRHNDPWRRTHA